MLRRIFVLSALVLALAAAAAPAEEVTPPVAGECSDGELSSDVPALFDFHEVIAPLWHDAWPNKNLALMRELLPQIEKHVANIRKVELPGILRDKQAKWNEGVADCAGYAGKLGQALAANEEQGALDAAESLHASFEGLVRIVRPRTKELDAYHQVLYRVYHYDWPQKDLAALAAHADELGVKCETLLGSDVPKRYDTKTPKIKAGYAMLCGATAELKAACAGKDEKAVGAAVEKVHAAYQACEAAFE